MQQDDWPHSSEAESALLASILANNKKFDEAAEYVDADSFFMPVHGRIFEAIRTLIAQGERANAVTLHHVFKNDDGLADAGGAGYLAGLVAGATAAVDVAGLARIVVDLWRRREIIRICREAEAAARDTATDSRADAIAAATEHKLDQIAASDSSRTAGITAGSAALAHIDVMEKIWRGEVTSARSGLDALDYRLGGFEPGELYILAGRPSMGKSALGINIAERIAMAGKAVYVWSGEMTAEQISSRLIARRTGIGTDEQRREPNQAIINAAIKATAEFSNLPMWIDDRAGMRPRQIESSARRWLRRHGALGMVVVDYLQLMDSDERHDSRVNTVSAISMGLKNMAMRLKTPVLALSQLNRGCEAREDKRPMLSDLRDSGSIEQDAGAVMFMYRDEYYLERQSVQPSDKGYEDWTMRMADANGKVEVIVAKNRHGRVGTERLNWNGLRQEVTS